MVAITKAPEDVPSSPELDDLSVRITSTGSSTTHSGETSPTQELEEDAALTTQKKKKKKKPKKSVKTKEAAAATATKLNAQDADGRPPVLCISRNKHWRYISSYHVRV